jgi:lactose/L-arabinose transport system ATP-binding protein
MNFFNAQRKDGSLVLGTGSALPMPGIDGSGDAIVGVRPEHFVFDSGDAGIEVKVDVVENLGGTRYVYGTLASGETVVIEDRDLHGFRAGDVISAGIAASRSFVFDTAGHRIRQGV